eukprot:103738-Chlamydomonas_euryale.AAC.2
MGAGRRHRCRQRAGAARRCCACIQAQIAPGQQTEKVARSAAAAAAAAMAAAWEVAVVRVASGRFCVTSVTYAGLREASCITAWAWAGKGGGQMA